MPAACGTLHRRTPRRLRTTKGDFHFRGSKSGCGWGAAGFKGFSHCRFLIVQDPGEQGAKAPCSPLSFHCRIVHCPLTIVDSPLPCLPAEVEMVTVVALVALVGRVSEVSEVLSVLSVR